MGIKFLSLQMIPWCFQVIGQAGDDEPAAAAAADGASTDNRTVKVIRSDGRVKIYHRAVNASELMTEFPKHLVCHSDSFTIGQKIPALSEDEELRLGHSYFLLPSHFFHSVLSFVTIASSFARVYASCSINGNKALLRPFDIHKTPSGTLQIRVSDEFIEKIKEEEEEEAAEGEQGSRVCTTAALEKDYKQLVSCYKERQWKPKLETIRESERRRVIGGAVINRAIKRTRSSLGNQQQINHAHKPEPPKPYVMFISKDHRKELPLKEDISKERRR